MIIRFIDFHLYPAALNMAIDEAICVNVRNSKCPPTFRLYGWEKESVTIGEFQSIEEINLNFCQNHNIPVVRRPTGGKGILHYKDITYSFSSKKEGVFKGSLFKSFEIISQILCKAFRLTGIDVETRLERRSINRSSICFALSSFGEICYKNVKIVGSAQKRWLDGFLQQGTIPLIVNREYMREIFVDADSYLTRIYGLSELNESFNIDKFIENIKSAIMSFGFQIVEEALAEEELELALELLQRKYGNPEWLFGKSSQYLSNRQKK